MKLTYEDFEDVVRRIRLAGRMDVESAREVDLKFTSPTASRQAFVIIDLRPQQVHDHLAGAPLVILSPFLPESLRRTHRGFIRWRQGFRSLAKRETS